MSHVMCHLASILGVLYSTLGLTQVPTTTVRGRLDRTGPDGARQPVPLLAVTLRNATTNVRTDPSYTGRDGIYYIYRVPPGQYYLEISVPPRGPSFTYLIEAKPQSYTDVAPILLPSEISGTGTISPGSPVIATIRIPYRAKLTYRRWMSPNVVVNVGTVDSGQTLVQLPYGGYLYFEATNLATQGVSLRSADCAKGCLVTFQ